MGIEKKVLDFEVEIHDAQFNHQGRYFVKLSIQSLHTRDYTSIQLKKPLSIEYLYDNEGLTDVTQQNGNAELVFFKEKRFVFRLPRGFCKNDKNHDVYLLLEAFTLPDNDHDMGKKVGEGKFAIYPRTNAPRINMNVEVNENMYHYTDVVSLLRTMSTDNATMHCGRLRCTFALREVIPKTTRRTPLPDPTPRPSPRYVEVTDRSEKKKVEMKTPSPTPLPTNRPTARDNRPPPKTKPTPVLKRASPNDSWGDNQSVNLPKTPPRTQPPPPPDTRRMTESPRPNFDHTTYTANVQNWRHVSKSGKEQIDIILHGASAVPATQKGKAPLPYASIKTKSDYSGNDATALKTHASARPTSAPSWEEMLSMEIDEKKSKDEALMLTIGDSTSKNRLVNYELPVNHLQPFHQYHLEMVVPNQTKPDGVRMYASIMRKLSKLPLDLSSPNYLGLEAHLQAVQRPIQNPVGPLIAVARIVPDYYNYRTDNLLPHPRTAGVNMTSVTFPQPHPSSFKVPEKSSQGYPQISLPGRPDDQPVWNHPFLFSEEKDKATLFTPGAALVIEYYVANKAMNDQFWRMESPVGFSSLLLDRTMYSQLTADQARMGLRIEGLPIQGSNMMTVNNRIPTVGMILRLITSDQPNTMVSYSNKGELPLIDLNPIDPSSVHVPEEPDVLTVSHSDSTPPILSPPIDVTPRQKTGKWVLQKVPKSGLPALKDGELPPFDAMDSVLPEYQYIFQEEEGVPSTVGNPVRTEHNNTTTTHVIQTNTGDQLPNVSSKIYHYDGYDDPDYMQVIQRQDQELGNYRTQLTKMGGEMVELRTALGNYETVQSNQRRDETSRILIDARDLDGLNKADLMARYTHLKQKFARTYTELKLYKDKVQRLQNELIKKNDQQKAYLKLTHAHTGQQELLQKLQAKAQHIKKLEDTIRKQEKVIDKLERALERRFSKTPIPSNNAGEINSTLSAENRHLRQQIEDLKEQLRLAGRSNNDDLEKLELYQALERAEGRIMSLERQLNENSRTWGKEKADLSIKANEVERGFRHGAGMILHDYPVLDEICARPIRRTGCLSPIH
ncbi:hypothetical protein SNE40_018803 [Patella caerulea]|uniref:Coiled-coil domain-containing protein 33 n=1 Tax=Patella caerulea TaxID=87958 RepID=A0AAN8P918_PATCE